MVSNESQPQGLDGLGRVAVRTSRAIARLWHQRGFDKIIARMIKSQQETAAPNKDTQSFRLLVVVQNTDMVSH